jgi:hypothetical protein
MCSSWSRNVWSSHDDHRNDFNINTNKHCFVAFWVAAGLDQNNPGAATMYTVRIVTLNKFVCVAQITFNLLIFNWIKECFFYILFDISHVYFRLFESQ